MPKYRATWILKDGTERWKEYDADGWVVQPNGITIFIKKKEESVVRLVKGEEQPQGEAIGAVMGYNYLEEV